MSSEPKKFKNSKEAYASLTESQKLYILSNWDKMKLHELAQKVFQNPSATAQTSEGLAIRAFLYEQVGEEEVKSKLQTTRYVARGTIEYELTDEQKQLIHKNSNTMKWLECARLIFNNPSLSPLSREAKAVLKEYKSFDPGSVAPEDDVVDEEYSMVTSIARLIPRVNKYLVRADASKKFVDPDNLKQQDIRNLNALLEYMRNYRFVYQISQYKNSIDRELFESSYIEFLHDKPDLLKEDIHNYISLCAEIVNIASMERTIQLISDKYYQILSGSSDEKMSQTLSETMDKMRAKQTDSKRKYSELMKMLVEDRAKRTDAKIGGATLYNMVNLWKQKETRDKMIDLADDRNKALETEVERLASLDALKAEIYGLDPDTISK